NFKKALKQAIVEKAEAVRIEDGQSPHLLHFSSEKAMAQLPVATTHDVQALMESLVATGEPLGETAREGVLAIVNFGELKLIAQFTSPLRLFAFIPPQGNQMYQQVKGQILGSEKPAPSPIDIAPNHGKFQLATYPAQSGDLDKLTMAPKKAALSVPPADDFDGGTATAALAPFAAGPQGADPFAMPPAKADPFASAALFQADPFPAPLAKADPFAGAAPAQASFAPDPFSSPALAKALPFESEIPAEHRKTHPTMVSSVRQEFSPIPSEVSQMGGFDSNLSLASAMHSGGRAPEHTDADYHYQGANSVAVRKPEPEPVDENVIHYSAFIPGETIDRNSRVFPIDTVLQDMIKRKASDLHATMGEVLCMRIDGEIERVGKEIVREDYMKSILDPIIPPRNREEFAKGNDTDFAYEIPGLARFRVNIFRDRMGVGAVLRQIPEKILSADDLGLPAAVRKFCELSKGLVVVTGPTGSGKSTTLAGMVDLINETRHEHILTIEDP
ncbi:MAG: hypothetical protein EOP07_24455, partial [Proteobacteria bacterium]